MDAILGVQHFEEEVLLHEHVLLPYSHWVPLQRPGSLNIAATNLDPSCTYVIRVFKLEQSVRMPK